MTEKTELKLFVFGDEGDRQMQESLLRMFYHAAFVNRIGVAQIEGDLYLVGIENAEEKADGSGVTASYYPLAKILNSEAVDALLPEESLETDDGVKEDGSDGE